MKYWRGYLVAAILAVCTFALRGFARAHSVLLDMFYPYVTRMVQTYLARRSSGVGFCLWQMLAVVMVALLLIGIVLFVLLRKNPIPLLGWVSATVAMVVFLHTGLYGLNAYSGSISQDVRQISTEYTLTELEKATVYYRDLANDLSKQVGRGDTGDVQFDDFETLALQASDGFYTLVYDRSLSVFAGSVVPVKKLSWGKLFSLGGVSGITVGLTGEAAVNPHTPKVMQPFEMCRQMAKRMCIVNPQDAAFAGFLACESNADVQFRYSGMLIGYRYCLMALREASEEAYGRVTAGQTGEVAYDMALCDAYFKAEETVCDLLVSRHIDKVVLPALQTEREEFDPLDKEQVGELN